MQASAPSTGSDAVQNLISAAKAKGLNSLCFIRHANAEPGKGITRVDQPHDWKVDDQLRMLTPRGLEQCTEASAWFQNLNCKAILASPARRAVDTAVRMKDEVETEEKSGGVLHVGMVEGIHVSRRSILLFADVVR